MPCIKQSVYICHLARHHSTKLSRVLVAQPMLEFSLIRVRDPTQLQYRNAMLYPVLTDARRKAQPVFHSDMPDGFWHPGEEAVYCQTPGLVFVTKNGVTWPKLASVCALYHEFQFNRHGHIAAVSQPYVRLVVRAFLAAQNKTSSPPWPNLRAVLTPTAYRMLIQKELDILIFPSMIKKYITNTLTDLPCKCSVHSRYGTSASPVHPHSIDVTGRTVCVDCYQALFRRRRGEFFSVASLRQHIPSAIANLLVPIGSTINYQRLLRGMMYFLCLNQCGHRCPWPTIAVLEKLGAVVLQNPILRLLSCSLSTSVRFIDILGVDKWAAYTVVASKVNSREWTKQYGRQLMLHGRLKVKHSVPHKIRDFKYPGKAHGDVVITSDSRIVQLYEFQQCIDYIQNKRVKIQLYPCYEGFRPACSDCTENNVVDAHQLGWHDLYILLRKHDTVVLYGRLTPPAHLSYSAFTELCVLSSGLIQYPGYTIQKASFEHIELVLESAVHSQTGRVVEGTATARELLCIERIRDTANTYSAADLWETLGSCLPFQLPPPLVAPKENARKSRAISSGSMKQKKRKVVVSPRS